MLRSPGQNGLMILFQVETDGVGRLDRFSVRMGILKEVTRKKRTAREQREITTEARGNYGRFSTMNKERTKEDASRNEILYKPVKVTLTEY